MRIERWYSFLLMRLAANDSDSSNRFVTIGKEIVSPIDYLRHRLSLSFRSFFRSMRDFQRPPVDIFLNHCRRIFFDSQVDSFSDFSCISLYPEQLSKVHEAFNQSERTRTYYIHTDFCRRESFIARCLSTEREYRNPFL